MAGGTDPTKTVVTALVANSVIAVSKMFAAAVTGSAGMLAEGFHSVADAGNQALLLLGLKRSRKPATEQHAFGFGKERFFWAFLVAVSLFSIGAAVSFYKGITGLVEGGHEVSGVVIPLVVLGLAFVFETYAFSVAYRQFQEVRTSPSLWRAIRDAKDPEIVTVLFEDTAALAGIAVASVGIILSELTGNTVWDSLAAVVIGLILTFVAAVLGRECHALLIGESASPEVRRQIRAACGEVAGVERVDELLTMHIGPHELVVAVDVGFAQSLDSDGVAEAVDRVEAAIQAATPAARRVFVEPA